jgi:hypothetical protein
LRARGWWVATAALHAAGVETDPGRGL